MLKYITEFIGTFVFLSIFLSATRSDASYGMLAPIAVGVALTSVYFFGHEVSGGHFNPAVSVMYALKDEIEMSELLPYVVSQVLAAIAAKNYYDYTVACR
jgi:aquaporin Z